MKIVLWTLLCFSLLDAKSIMEKYPSYSYVFHEFDVDKSYIDDAEFVDFIYKNEKNLAQFYLRSLKKGETLLPSMKGMLVNEGVSDLFIYLSMVESGFSNRAISPKKAVGLWQFMPKTAQQYNLMVCDSYDERYDPVSSTSAAIRYLNKLYRQFGKWYLAAMAYNCGEGCVERAIQKADSDALSILIDERLALVPKETRDYIRNILLIAMIGENSILDTSDTLKIDNNLTEVEVDAGADLHTIAKILKMKYKVLQKMNRKMKNGKVPTHKKKYTIMIPMDKIYAFYLRYKLMESKEANKPHLISHYVALGESLESIAKKYDTSVEEISQTNHLKDDYLYLDQVLIIPVNKNMFESILISAKR